IDISDQSLLKTIFIENGWTLKTAISMIIFTLFHWPCSTTLMSIKKETGSFFYTLVAFALPSLIGISLCLILNLLL
ncbi:MAG: ferrous iron transporter B, partial [Clostridia bacterium]|nr:ferrous iron transporter B [Clostridia bacterium]